ncbi:MAG: tripartite tricarboxylate transporter substrate binding protein, partial [Burkholderiales bacterium]|nr:tripartite tricarboxylate transporter substrate binding protein [Burkholderiales bacterium]
AAPAKTPSAVLQRLNHEVLAALQSPDVIQSLTRINVQPRPGTPAQLAELLRSEIRRWSAVIRSAGIPRQ